MECITHCHCISHLIIITTTDILPDCIIPHQTPSLTDIQSKPHWPHSTSNHHSSTYRTYHIDDTDQHLSLFHFALPYFKWHHMGHISCASRGHISLALHPGHFTIPHDATLHVLRPRPISDHAIYWPHYAGTTAPRRVTPHFTHQLHRIWHMIHIFHNCTISPHLTRRDLTPNSTHDPATVFRITFH